MIFNDPELNLRAEYSLFDRQTGRLICQAMGNPVSDSDRTALSNIHVHHLIYAHWHRVGLCKPYGRLYVNLDESDEFGTFIF